MSSRRPEPRPFQIEGTAWLDTVERGILGDDPGLGKTGQAILAATEPALIIGPAALEGTWLDEIEMWRPDLGATFVSYSSLCRRVADSKGRMTKVTPTPRPEYKRVWGTVICDEAHYLKGRNTNWTKATGRLQSDRLFLLTGTPVPNWSHEIHMLLRLLNPGDRRFSSYWRWVEEWFAVWEPKWGGRKVGRLKDEHTWGDFIAGNELDKRMLRRSRDDVLTDLPPMTQHPATLCPMTPTQRRAYTELKQDYLTWVEGHGEQVAWSAGALHSKLAQITTGLDTLTDGEARGSGKLDRLAEDMAERRHSPTVVGCQFKATARAAVRVLDSLGIKSGLITGAQSQTETDRARRAFQAGEITALVGTNDKMAEGMTLTAADTLIHLERSWRPSRNDQMIRRVHRMGQTRPVNYITYVTPDSIDDAMTRTLATKTDEQIGMLDAHAFARLLLDT